MDRQKLIAEAVERMKMLKLHPNTIRELSRKNFPLVNRSDAPYAALYWLDEKEQTMVRNFESKYDGLVYHVIHNHTSFGELYSLLYVSKYEEEWADDRADLQQGYALAYVENVDDPMCSEFGSIGVKPLFGGVIRTA